MTTCRCAPQEHVAWLVEASRLTSSPQTGQHTVQQYPSAPEVS
ncbi:hypothetical protein BH11MYX4_BH11MYX4_68930 [soil metagenome]